MARGLRGFFGDPVQSGGGQTVHCLPGGASPEDDFSGGVTGVAAQTSDRMGRTLCVGLRRNPVGVVDRWRDQPRVASQTRQPWALRRNPFGIYRNVQTPAADVSPLHLLLCFGNTAVRGQCTVKSLLQLAFREFWIKTNLQHRSTMKVNLAYGHGQLVVELPKGQTTIIEPAHTPGLPDE